MTVQAQASPSASGQSVQPSGDQPIKLLEYSSPIAWSKADGGLTPSGCVRLYFQEREATGTATGNDNVGALFGAMMDAVRQLSVFSNGEMPTLVDRDVQNLDAGSNARGVATVVMAYRGRQVIKRRIGTNTVYASMTALLDSLNDFVHQTENGAPAAVESDAAPDVTGPEGSD